MDERERRLAKNEVLFRNLNDQVERIQAERIARSEGPDEHEYDFMCECSNIDCDLRLRLSLAAYEAARADPTVFIVAPGHELPEIETIVSRLPAYQLVRKHGEAANIARQHKGR